MSKVRLWICPECGTKYWPDPEKKWDMICPKDDTHCRPEVIDETIN